MPKAADSHDDVRSATSVENGNNPKAIRQSEADTVGAAIVANVFRGLARYIIRNPISIDKMQFNTTGGTITYRSEINSKIQRNFEVINPSDFFADIAQHIPDKSFQFMRYDGWYSNINAAEFRQRNGGS